MLIFKTFYLQSLVVCRYVFEKVWKGICDYSILLIQQLLKSRKKEKPQTNSTYKCFELVWNLILINPFEPAYFIQLGGLIMIDSC